MDQTQAQLNAHEAECAVRYEMVKNSLDALDKRLWRLEAMNMLSTAAMIGLGVVLITNL